MRLKNTIYLLIFVGLILGFTVINPSFDDGHHIDARPIRTKTKYIAGDEIVLKFKVSEPIELYLWLQSSYCETLLKSQLEDENLIFKIPPFISNKKGVLRYTLISNNQKLYSNKLKIEASNRLEKPLESYLGPTSITAGGTDYGMITVLPTDTYDNPLEDSTSIHIQSQFLKTINNSEFYLHDFIVWDRIYSYEKSGRILVSAYADKSSSKEFTMDVFPSQAQDFDLHFSRRHKYADGNQIIEFYTSVIKDNFGNIISDGRLVEFSIMTANKERLRTTGTSINGIAKAYMIHPSTATAWNVQAFIPEMAESNIMSIVFESAVKDYDVTFSDTNRKIIIGPILSFMNQVIPDGVIFSLELTINNKGIETLTEFSSEGFVVFDVSEDFFPEGIYTLEIEGMGITKKYNHLELK